MKGWPQSSFLLLLTFPLGVHIQWGVVGCGEGVVYLTLPGRPTDIGLYEGCSK